MSGTRVIGGGGQGDSFSVAGERGGSNLVLFVNALTATDSLPGSRSWPVPPQPELLGQGIVGHCFARRKSVKNPCRNQQAIERCLRSGRPRRFRHGREKPRCPGPAGRCRGCHALIRRSAIERRTPNSRQPCPNRIKCCLHPAKQPYGAGLFLVHEQSPSRRASDVRSSSPRRPPSMRCSSRRHGSVPPGSG